MAKVLFIERKIRDEKQGLMYLSAVLKEKGHETEVVQTEEEDIFSIIEKFNPDFFAYSICTGEHKHALELNSQLKQKYPGKLSIFGGPHVTFFPEIANEEGVDYAVIGEGEEAIIDIVNGSKQKIIKKPLIRDINSLPLPDRSLMYKYDRLKNNPMKNIITQRDCPYSCTYCYNHIWRELFKDEKEKLFQRKDVDYVIKEIKDIQQQSPVKKILIQDDNFIGIGEKNKKWIEEFCEKYKKEINLPFLCSLRVNVIDEELIKKLKDAGLEMVNFALESADPYVQHEILNRGQITNQDVEKAIALFKKYGIRCRMQNMIGLPLENPLKDAMNTLEFNLKNRVDDSWVSIYQPYPKTRLGEYCLEKGFVTGDLLKSCADSFFDESRLNIPDKDKLQRLQKWWHFIVRYNLPLEFVNILLEVPLTQENMKMLQELRFRYAREKLYGIG